ncbi:MAG: choice-of-anchor B family protein [Bacteroidota bacterium]
MTSFPSLSYLTCLCFLLGLTTLQSQTPCTGGTASGYPCNNVALQSRMPLSDFGAGRSNDIWGWTSPSSFKEYAILGLNNGTAFVDITNPVSPTLVGTLATASGNSTWRDIKVKANYAYIVSEASSHGIQVFDLTQLDAVTSPPATFTADNTVTIPGSGRAHNIVAHENSDYIYPVGTSNCFGGLLFYDATNPVAPSYTDCYSNSNYTHDAVCFIYNGPDTEHTGKEICIGFNDNVFVILDVTQKDDPELISSTGYTGNHYAHQGWTTDDQRYLFLDDELDESNFNHNTKTYVFDISDLDNPTSHLTYLSSFGAIDHNQYVKGSYLYQSNYQSGLRILDISDIDNANIFEVAYFDLYASNDNAGFNGTWSVYPYFESGNIVISGIRDNGGNPSGGLFVLQANLPHSVMRAGGNGVNRICQGENTSFSVNLTAYSGFTEAMTLSTSTLPSGVSANFSSNPVAANGFTTLTFSGTGNLAPGNHYFTITGTSNTGPTQRISVSVMVDPFPDVPQLVFPNNEEIIFDPMPVITWQEADESDFYSIEIADDPSMTNIIQSATNLFTTQYTANPLPFGTAYFWRVTGHNDCGETTSFTQVFSVKQTVLPVELLDFSAEVKDQQVVLQWSTSSETNNKGFALERLHDQNDRDFSQINWQNSKGNEGAQYQHLDMDVIAGQSYLYRLKQIDIDGQFSYSRIVSVTIPREGQIISIQPNPASDRIQVRFGPTIEVASSQLSLHDISGRLLQEVDLTLVNDNQYDLGIDHLPNGIYILRLTNGAVDMPLRFVKL